jgi:hypothetical protein
LQKNNAVEHNVIEDKSLFQGEDVLIIGNGFDLDLELKTSYGDFYGSDYWPFHEPKTQMGAFLEHERSINHWMDLEEKIGEYAIRSHFRDIKELRHYPQKNQEDYEILTSKLGEFLAASEKGNINNESVASRILVAHFNSISIPNIITFNYTNINGLAQRLGLKNVFSSYYVHGNLIDNNIILGVGESYTFKNFKIQPDNDFLYKTSSPHYNPPQIADMLDNAPNITFFGLSLGGMDAPYFSGLFQNLSKQIGKHITFITRDEESRLQILRHLRNVEGINLHDVCTRHHIEFIRTKDNIDEEKVKKYIDRLDIKHWDIAK